jgi:hypothetical protein
MSGQKFSVDQKAVTGYHLLQPKPMHRQTLIWTVVPNGRTANKRLKLSVVVAPRLEILQGPPEASLHIYFPDFADWPAWLKNTVWGQFNIEFVSDKTGVSIATKPASHAIGVQPDSQAWMAVFPDSTIVRSYVFTVEKITIDPIPADNTQIINHLQGLYSNIGLESAINPPTTETLMRQEFLGALMQQTGLSQGKMGLQQGVNTQSSIGSSFAGMPGSAGPAGGMKTMSGKMPPGFSPGGSAGQPMQIFTRNQQLVAGKPVLSSLTSLDVGHAYKPYLGKATATMQRAPNVGALQIQPHQYDFHEIVTILREYPDMLRRLGLVIDLEVDAPSVGDPSVGGAIRMRVVHNNLGTQGNTLYNATPWTVCQLGTDQFHALSKDGSLHQGMLPLKDATLYEPVQLDVEGSALKALQFASQLQQAKNLGKDNTAATNAMPALRSVGIGVHMQDRVKRQQNLFDQAQDLETNLFKRDGNGNIIALNEDLTLYAENITRGMRIDAAVYDEPTATWRWHSLCRRILNYQYGQTTLTNDDSNNEGTVTTGLTKDASSAPDDPYQIMEALFRWNGWSLCAPRPGQTDLPVLAQSGEAQGLYLKASSSIVKGTLPRLRFGRKYRFRARSVDIAGNSLPPDMAEDDNTTAAATYRRFEPIGTPLLVPQKQLGPQSPGESLETMVIRSNYNAPMEEACVRHLAPPKVSPDTAEVHGKFDVPIASLKASPIMAGVHGKFNGPTGLDAAKSISLITSQQGSLPDFEPADSVAINYLPDPLACGIALGLLPCDNKFVENYFFDNTSNWPDLKSLRLKLIEGSDPPKQAGNEITVSLPKAEVVHMPYASLICGEEGLKLMALWGWVEDEYAKQKISGNIDGATLDQLYNNAKALALAGAHWMLTPRREIRLVHAVKQPLMEPVVVPVFNPSATKPKVMRRDLHATWSHVDAVIETHGKSTVQIDLLAQWNEIVNDPESAPGWSEVPVNNHVLNAPVHLDFLGYPTSTGGLAYYLPHPEDDFGSLLRGGLFLGAYIDQAVVVPDTKTPVNVQQQNPDALKVADTFGLPEKWKDASVSLAKIVAPRHEFGDTKHRKVSYTATGTTRFREYFLPARNENSASPFSRANMVTNIGKRDDIESQFTRSGPSVEVHIPNSARPGLLKLAYVIPTFGWEPEQKAANVRSRTRHGNGLRVYLEGPWFLSGEDELLGVVIKPQPMRSHIRVISANSSYYVTQWGQDPIWESAPLPVNYPSRDQFSGYQEYTGGLSLAETGGNNAAVLGYAVHYDKTRGLWYADIEMDPGNAYFPFVRLALARYQPYSVDNAHLSHVLLADFVQLAPDRHATIETHSGSDGSFLQVSVSGVSYGNDTQTATKTSSPAPPIHLGSNTGSQSGSAQNSGKISANMESSQKTGSHNATTGSLFEAGLEKARDGIKDDTLKWESVAGSTVSLQAATFNMPLSKMSYTWSGNVPLPKKDDKGSYRLVIREYEVYKRESHPGTENVRRLIYADTFNL